MILKIKNMESRRCKTLVKHAMDKLGFQNITVELGEVEFEGDISDKKLKLFDSALKDLGLEILVDRRSQLIAKIKDLFINWFISLTISQNQTIPIISAKR